MGGGSSKPNSQNIINNTINKENSVAVSLVEESIKIYDESIKTENNSSATNRVNGDFNISNIKNSTVNFKMDAQAKSKTSQTYSKIYEYIMDSKADAWSKLDAINGLINSAVNEGGSLLNTQSVESNTTINEKFNLSNSVQVLDKIEQSLAINAIVGASALNEINGNVNITDIINSNIIAEFSAKAESEAEQLQETVESICKDLSSGVVNEYYSSNSIKNDQEMQSLLTNLNNNVNDLGKKMTDSVESVLNKGIGAAENVATKGIDTLGDTAKTGIWATFGTTGIVIAVIVGLILLLVLGGFAIFVFKKLMNTATTGGYDDDDL